MKDSLAYQGSILWNLVNYNEKINNVSFKELKKRLTARDYFKLILLLMAQLSLRRDTDSVTMCIFKFFSLLVFNTFNMYILL